MSLNLKKWINIGILSGSFIINASNLPAKNLEEKAAETHIVQVQERKNKSVQYQTIRDIVINDFLDDYLHKVTPKSSNFKKLRKKYGEKGLLEKYCSAHELTLELAERYQWQDKIPEKEYIELGLQLAQKQNKTSKGISRINYLDKKVIEAFQKWGRLKTENFSRLLKASEEIPLTNLDSLKEKQDYVRKIHLQAYTKEEYAKYVKAQNKANDELYESMMRTLNRIERFFGNKEINTIARVTRKIYQEPLKRYFENENQ